MTKTIEDLFYYIATYIPLLPCLVFFLTFTQSKKNKVLKVILLYAVCEFLTNFSTQFVTMRVTLQLYSIFTLTEYSLLSWAFFLIIKAKIAKKIIFILSICFTAFWLIYRFYGPKNVLDSVPIGVASILLLIYAFYFLFEEMDNVSDGPLYTRFSFWIVSGILIYLAGNFFLYVFANQVDTETRQTFWMFGNLCSILKNIAFAISIRTFMKNRYLPFSLRAKSGIL